MKLQLLFLLTAVSTWPADCVHAQAKLPIPNQPNIAAVQPQMNEVAKTIIAQHPNGSDAAVTAILAIAANETDPAKKYAALQQALSTAISSGLAGSALTTIETIESAFETDAYVIRFDTIKQILPKINSVPEKLSLLGPMLEAARDASAVLDYKIAEDACAIVLRNLPNAQRREAQPFVTQLRASIQSHKSLDNNYVNAMKHLGDAPDDPDAHTIAGKYTFFILDNLQQALPHFAKSKVPELEAIANLENLNAPSKDQVRSLADLWWTLSTNEPQIYRQHAVKRAAYWYMKFVDELNGVEKALVLSRIDASYTSDRMPFIQHNLMRPGLHRPGASYAINDAQGVLSLYSSAYSYCQFVLAPPDNYDVEYHFTRTAGQWGLFFVLPCQNRSFAWSHAGSKKAEAAFHAVAQPHIRNNGHLDIPDGKLNVLLLKIRTNRFQCFHNGTLVSEVRDPFEPNVAHPNDPANPISSQPYLAIGDYWGNLTVTKAVLTEFH